MRMNPRAKARWVAALRSGEYAQARGDLINRVGHCCLGVLADELWPEFVRHPGEKCGDIGCILARGRPSAFGTIPSDLAATVGLDNETQDRLANMNDQGVTFPPIADWIEENL